MPLGAFAQQTPLKVPRLGLLLFNSPQTDPIAPLLEGLQALGYVDGKNIGIDYRSRKARLSGFLTWLRNWSDSSRT
jgi:hypothetical protein